MGHTYQAISWNRQKKRYDRYLLIGVVLYLLIFSALYILLNPDGTPETLIIRATGTLGILMLHMILMIGPLARLNNRFLPLLYNRRHFGVSMFLIGAIHAIFSIIQFHALGNVNPIASIFLSNTDYSSLADFPFQVLGFFALIILLLMAVTSHDFWLANLSPKFWKGLHMMVYVAYGLLIMHVMLGVVQSESHSGAVGYLGVGLVMVVGLHIVAGGKQLKTDKARKADASQFVKVAPPAEFIDGRAKMIVSGKENIAIFRNGNAYSAISNVCKHQNGPLGEGKIVNGCVVCPWHGYEYQPADGCSPPPFTEKVSTYDLKLEDGHIWVKTLPHPEGTYVEPLTVSV